MQLTQTQKKYGLIATGCACVALIIVLAVVLTKKHKPAAKTTTPAPAAKATAATATKATTPAPATVLKKTGAAPLAPDFMSLGVSGPPLTDVYGYGTAAMIGTEQEDPALTSAERQIGVDAAAEYAAANDTGFKADVGSDGSGMDKDAISGIDLKTFYGDAFVPVIDMDQAATEADDELKNAMYAQAPVYDGPYDDDAVSLQDAYGGTFGADVAPPALTPQGIMKGAAMTIDPIMFENQKGYIDIRGGGALGRRVSEEEALGAGRRVSQEALGAGRRVSQEALGAGRRVTVQFDEDSASAHPVGGVNDTFTLHDPTYRKPIAMGSVNDYMLNNPTYRRPIAMGAELGRAYGNVPSGGLRYNPVGIST
jgi:hypothetical protein